VAPAAAAGGAAASADAAGAAALPAAPAVQMGGVGTTSKNCLHECALPEDYDGDLKIAADGKTLLSIGGEDAGVALGRLPRREVRDYPFELDPFQKRAAGCIQRGESVLVAAHTSAGKTAVAEYAIALALHSGQRVIYTSPIKALSNQKFNDLNKEFSDVGLMTGDITINPNASCLVMTTEILRSMLYRGTEIVHEVGWVIFDEVHYMRDKERGVVWEESIILTPKQANFVFLSATIPNALEFAQWVCHEHSKPCHVIYTEYRPTPLQHYLLPAGGKGIYMVVNEKGEFKEKQFDRAVAELTRGAEESAFDAPVTNDSSRDFGGGRSERQANGQKRKREQKQRAQAATQMKSDLLQLVTLMIQRKYDPIIVFAFSKREVESQAMALQELNLLEPDQAAQVQAIWDAAMAVLSAEDQHLSQIEAMLPHLKRGIAFHHGGLLPILKEVVEIMFGEGLVRVLFATETFAMGINMPAKTVIFTACRKFDGTDFRWMQSGEYIQMSGRAGRRGLDDRGIVVQILDEKMEPEVCRAILKGTAEPLLSTFHLGYNMLLNALRMEDFEPTKLIKGSFYQFQQLVGLPEKRKVAELAEAEADAIVVANEDEVDDYWRITEQLARAEANARRIVSTPAHLMPFLQAGRLVRVSGQQWNAHSATTSGAGDDDAESAARSVDDARTDWGWGTVVSCSKLPKSGGGAVGGGAAGETRTIVDVLLHVKQRAKAEDGSEAEAPATYEPCGLHAPKSEGGEMKVLPVVLQMVNQVSAIRIYLPSDLTQRKNRNNVWISLTEVFNRFEEHEDSTGKGYVPLLDPIRDMGITDPELAMQVGRATSLYGRLQASPMHVAADRDARFAAFSRRKALRAMAAKVRRDVHDTETGDMHDTLKVSILVFTVTLYANHAHNLTRSP
jgi:ATP-dependent RNA helicase DOB1